MVWKTFRQTFQIYHLIEGEQRAAAFAYYALFSLIPLLALLLAIGSFFFNPEAIHHTLSEFFPLSSEERNLVFFWVNHLIAVRGGISIVALIMLTWSSLRFFQALIHAINEAWQIQTLSWWQIPLKNLTMLGVIVSAVILGILIPAIFQIFQKLLLEIYSFFYQHFHHPLSFLALQHFLENWNLSQYLISSIILFYAFSLLYILAPNRKMIFSEVWQPACLVTVLLQVFQVIFIKLLPYFMNYSKIYGSIGGLMLLLLWIYVSGQLIILGGCLCAAHTMVRNGNKN